MKMLLSIFLITILLSSCQYSDTASPREMVESRVGDYLAKSMPTVNVSVEKVDVSQQQDISISYVTYRVDEKVFSNLAFVKGKGKLKAGGTLYYVNDENGGGYVVKCSGTCDGSNTACSMKGEYNPSTNTNTLECSCAGCKMSVNQQ